MTMTIIRLLRAEQDPVLREQLEARRSRELVTLLDRHADLRGVSATADFLADSVRWTA
jgi:hypothetical protein